MIKNIILWKYERASWQWDLLCVLIILFIFLTPKAWFEKREATRTERVAVKVQDFSSDKFEINKQVKTLSGNPKSEVLEWRKTQNATGETFYRIDIR